MPEEKKQRLKEYQKNYREAKNSQRNDKFFNCDLIINKIVF